jgi:hypothetical protein
MADRQQKARRGEPSPYFDPRTRDGRQEDVDYGDPDGLVIDVNSDEEVEEMMIEAAICKDFGVLPPTRRRGSGGASATTTSTPTDRDDGTTTGVGSVHQRG